MQLVFLILFACMCHTLLAQTSVPVAVTQTFPAVSAAAAEAASAAYWTSERMRDAKPVPLPARGTGAPTAGSTQLRGAAASASNTNTNANTNTNTNSTSTSTRGFSGAPPTITTPSNATFLFAPKAVNTSGAFSSDLLGEGVSAAYDGVTPLYYSSSQIVPLSADTAYPHSAIGKLFFSAVASTGTPRGDYQCSASVVGLRVILTAGHCVHSGKNGQAGWYSNFRFMPSFRDGFAPFGTWTHRAMSVSSTWFYGWGAVPNAADYAALVLNDINGFPVAARVGRLGLALGVLAPNQISQFGYPCNIDNCVRMHRVDSGSFVSAGNNCFEYGSDMGGGASGGPWIQNFGVPGSGQPAPNNKDRTLVNAVVGVSSYGPLNANAGRFLGASTLDARVISVLDAACGTIPNCR